MKKNCFELLIREIRTLDPNIVIIQATDYDALPEENIEKLLSEFSCDGEQYGKDNRARLYSGRLNDHEIHIAQTLHGAYGGFKSHAYLKNELNPILDEIIMRAKKLEQSKTILSHQYNNVNYPHTNSTAFNSEKELL